MIYKAVALFFILAVMASTQMAQGATVSWWRFEAGQDVDPDSEGFENPNEIATEPAMISADATLGTSAPDLFDTIVPQVGVPNTGSIRSATNGSATDGIFGSAAYSSTLDLDSITVEFWMRTTESEAGFVARTTDFNDAGESGNLDNGFRIVDPENVRVEYWTANNGGQQQTLRTLTSNVSVNDGEWHYIAWTYDNSTGIGELYIDTAAAPVVSRNDNDNRNIWWGGNSAQPEVFIGYRMDGNPANNTGTLDEIRFTDEALPPDELLVVPEASQVMAATMLCLLGFVAWIRQRLIPKC